MSSGSGRNRSLTSPQPSERLDTGKAARGAADVYAAHGALIRPEYKRGGRLRGFRVREPRGVSRRASEALLNSHTIRLSVSRFVGTQLPEAGPQLGEVHAVSAQTLLQLGCQHLPTEQAGQEHAQLVVARVVG
jgi:hypothetical protein